MRLAERLFDHLAAGELDSAVALFAPTVDFAIPSAPDIPWIPRVRSAEDMGEFFTLLRTELDSKRFEVTKILADGEDAVVLGHLVSTVRSTGRDIVTEFAIQLGVQDGLINRYRMYEDSWAVANAVRPA